LPEISKSCEYLLKAHTRMRLSFLEMRGMIE
jgi:hypothetical protein